MADESDDPGASGRAAAVGPGAGPEPNPAAVLATAQALLERGDYGQVLRLLEPLAALHRPATAVGAELRLLQATALIGQGRPEEAAACCRALRGCADPDLRARARELQQVLEAPALERPRDWSLQLPDLGAGATLEGFGAAARNRRARRPPPPPPPPVGPTRAPYGFAALAGLLLLMVLLASLLGGCVEVRTELHIAGPGRLQVSHAVHSQSGTPGPWQRRLAVLLEQQGFRSRSLGADTRLVTEVLPAGEALRRLATSFETAARLADLPLPPPHLSIEEHNWLLGVRQRLQLSLDLSDLPSLPGLALAIDLDPFAAGSVRQAAPLAVEHSGHGRLHWPLQPGRRNSLELHSWRWSPLGLGALAIALLLPLVLFLQRLRRQLGFGLPELPA